jgi:uncharacterized protein
MKSLKNQTHKTEDPPPMKWKIAVISIVSTILLILDNYHSPILPWKRILCTLGMTTSWNDILDRTLLYLIIPMILILVVFKESPVRYGFSLGNWKKGILFTIGGILIVTPIIWLVGSFDSGMNAYYSPMRSELPWQTLLNLLGWEFLFRGWILFGYASEFGLNALWLQAVPFALAHIGKPELETISTIFGGFAFGWIALKTRSFLYPLLIHWFVASFIIISASL